MSDRGTGWGCRVVPEAIVSPGRNKPGPGTIAPSPARAWLALADRPDQPGLSWPVLAGGDPPPVSPGPDLCPPYRGSILRAGRPLTCL